MLSSFSLVWVVYAMLLPLSGIPGFVVCWYFTFLAMYWAAVLLLRGRLPARDALMGALVTTGAAAVVIPLGLVIGFVIYKGVALISPHFFVATTQFCGELSAASCGGVGHAIVGTLEQVGIAVLFAVPLAILCAVFLSEIGGPLRRPVFLFVDAMSGVPSIVAGLFIYAVWVIGLNRGFNGLGASLALAILMLPTVTRTSFEVLRLVPSGLREGALALGASEWRTTVSVVLPTARSGLITAVVLGIARAVGETAPLLFTAFGASVMNANPLNGPQEALPAFVYEYIRFNPGTGPYQRAWSAALTLTFLVLLLFTSARVIGSLMSVEHRQRRAVRRERRAVARAAAQAGAT
ncbi:MAG: phosphate ABC transporter permease PstA [Candidatus Dormibacteraeota bacterium]|nr:phosphate ABC transporter permease PstA [Candidatus Dormibacteraeota bacterium]